MCPSNYMSLYLSTRLLIFLSDYLSVCPSIYISVYLLICLTTCLCVYLTTCISIFPSICLSVCPSIYLSVNLPTYPSDYLCVHLFSLSLSLNPGRGTSSRINFRQCGQMVNCSQVFFFLTLSRVFLRDRKRENEGGRER